MNCITLSTHVAQHSVNKGMVYYAYCTYYSPIQKLFCFKLISVISVNILFYQWSVQNQQTYV